MREACESIPLKKSRSQRGKTNCKSQVQKPFIELQTWDKSKILRPDGNRKRQGINNMCTGKTVSEFLRGLWLSLSWSKVTCGIALCWSKGDTYVWLRVFSTIFNYPNSTIVHSLAPPQCFPKYSSPSYLLFLWSLSIYLFYSSCGSCNLWPNIFI